MSNLWYWYVDSWCATTFVSGITETSIKHPNFPSLDKIIDEMFEDNETPVLGVTVNEDELSVIEWLKENKFKKGPLVRNWGHGGRKTQAWFYQIPKKVWLEKTGRTLTEW